VETLLSVGLANAAAAGGLAVVALAIARRRRPALAHALWLLVLLKLVTPPLWPVKLPRPQAEPQPTVVPTSAVDLPSPEVLAATLAAIGPEPEPFPWMEYVAAAWLGGSLLWWGLAAWRIRRFLRLLRQACPAPEPVTARARHLAARMGLKRCPEVRVLPGQVSPLLWGLGRRPVLLLPAGLWPRLNAEQQDTLLLHELAHLRRGDHWVRRLELLVLGLYWWDPVAWWAQRRLHDAEEECCDGWVVAVLPESAPAYAAALVETAAFLSAEAHALPAAASGVGHFRFLKRRLTMILLGKTPPRLSRWGVLVVLAAAALLPVVPTWADPAEPPATRPESAAPADHEEAVRQLKQLEKSCLACHQAGPPLHAATMEHWMPLHDEAARLWQELARARGTAKKDAADTLQAAQEAVELLQAQVEVKEAELEAVRVGLDTAQRRFARLVKAQQVAPGSISQEDYEAAQGEVARLKAQVRLRQAELREPTVRLRQAERRLAALQKASRGEDADKRSSQEERLLKLEKDLKKLLDQVQALERERNKLGK
jgi:beta-lactamase regulating signal transducer with metallopeptidase domain